MNNKINRFFKGLHRGQKGITGLETAIILIAFVTVASVLAYSVLSAGIFSSEKGKGNRLCRTEPGIIFNAGAG